MSALTRTYRLLATDLGSFDARLERLEPGLSAPSPKSGSEYSRAAEVDLYRFDSVYAMAWA
jgi:hypothetical protein